MASTNKTNNLSFNVFSVCGTAVDTPEVSSHDFNESGGSRTVKKAKFRIQFFSANDIASDITVTCWGKQAEEVDRILRAGTLVFVSGTLRSYEGTFDLTAKVLSIVNMPRDHNYMDPIYSDE